MTLSTCLTTALFLSSVSLLTACGGKSFDSDPDPTQGASGPGGSGPVGGTGAGGSSSKGGSAQGGAAHGGSAQGGSAAVCQSFDDEPGMLVQVTIINKTQDLIYLGQDMVTCGVSPLFQVQDAAGKSLPSPGSCRAPCQSVRTAGAGGCVASCAFPSSQVLGPGEMLYTSWDGLFQVPQELPKQCVAANYGEASCDQAKQIAQGNFTFFAQAGRSVDCGPTTGGVCGPCMASGIGGCTIPGSLISGERLKATTTVLLDDSYGVHGQGLPAPVPALPDDPGGDVPSGVSALLTVELVFTE